MITEQNWINFIQDFLQVETPQEWLHHVIANWNHLKNEPGCHCRYSNVTGALFCEDYQLALEHSTAIQTKFVDAEDEDEEPYTWDSFKSS